MRPTLENFSQSAQVVPHAAFEESFRHRTEQAGRSRESGRADGALKL